MCGPPWNGRPPSKACSSNSMSIHDLPAVYCDPEKAGRVIINLATNAIKFCGQPGHVRLSLPPRARQSPGVVLSVTDNGTGISTENQQAIFRRFKQLGDSSRAAAPRGSDWG